MKTFIVLSYFKACCAVFDGDGCWYRAEIIGIPTPFTVLVRNVTYKVKPVSKIHLYGSLGKIR